MKYLPMLGDIEIADVLDLLLRNHEQLQTKTTVLKTKASKIGLKINTRKTKVMAFNTSRTQPARLGNKEIENIASLLLGKLNWYNGR